MFFELLPRPSVYFFATNGLNNVDVFFEFPDILEQPYWTPANSSFWQKQPPEMLYKKLLVGPHPLW